MSSTGGTSNRALLVAVAMAFTIGVIVSLALRPPGASAPSNASASSDGRPARPRIEWRVPIAFSTNLPALGDNVIYVTSVLREASGGAIVLKPFEPGELVPAFSITDAVRDAKIEAGYTWLGYDQGRIPSSPLISAVPFGMEPWEFMAWWYEGGGEALAQDIYRPHGTVPILCGLIGPETAGWFRSPIETLEDFKGLKIRFAGLGGKVLESLGASVTMIPGGEIFQALERGAIDATEYSLPVVDEALGFDRIAKFNYFPGWHQTFTAAHLVVNAELWETVAAADRALVRLACTAGVTRNLARAEALQGPVIAGYAAKGISARRLPRDLLEELRRVTREVLAEEAAQDEFFARVLASQAEFQADYVHWKRLAYLPRDF
ncbi:MAG: TRAP transporter substrate-binding protein [Gammaproteobacteria bacterium]|nr:TRAP transporter substrate-binding protein [Gammaproteobacteria bacterium]